MQRMTRKSSIALVIVVLLGVGSAFWLGRNSAPQSAANPIHDGQQSDSATQTKRATDPAQVKIRVPAEDPPNRIAIPADIALLPGMSVPQASNWEQLLAELDPEQRKIAEAFAARYPDAFQFSKPEQLRWMVDNGYPMPEEIIEAQLMPRDELIELAKSGNPKAQLLATDREASELMNNYESLPENERNLRELDLTMLGAEAAGSCSPFAGYVTMSVDRYWRRFDPDHAPYSLLGRLSYILARGDWRVETTMQVTADELGLPPETLQALFWSGHSYAGLMRNACPGTGLPR